MKLINYKYGYFQEFTCSIHGKIRMTYREWKKARTYLLANYLKRKSDRSFFLPILRQDIERRINTKKSFIINIRVTATEQLVNHFKVKNYKRGNYILEIIK